jgi:CubicO group peptidase (beta-lactamase class C family)
MGEPVTSPAAPTPTAAVRGTCDPRFARVADAFARNLATGGEVGAAVCVTLDGEPVVDLAGGVADLASGRPWMPDTLVVTWSCTKGVTAVLAHLLASRGELQLDAPVARYWPQFTQRGKGAISVAMLLNHQAGLPGLRECATAAEVLDFDAMVARLEREAPLWQPGTRHGYHSFTYGWLVGEVIRRVSGRMPGELLAEAVAGPLGLELWIGLPEEHEPRVATTILAPPPLPGASAPYYEALLRGEPLHVAVDNTWGAFGEPGGCDTRAAHAATLPAVNGIASARGLALLYMALATDGRIGETTLGRESRRRMTTVESASAVDAILLSPSRFASGFEKRPAVQPEWGPLRIPEEAFGHSGMGGSLGFADPARRLSFGYVMNRHGSGAPADDRCQSLVEAAYASIGCVELV